MSSIPPVPAPPARVTSTTGRVATVLTFVSAVLGPTLGELFGLASPVAAVTFGVAMSGIGALSIYLGHREKAQLQLAARGQLHPAPAPQWDPGIRPGGAPPAVPPSSTGSQSRSWCLLLAVLLGLAAWAYPIAGVPGLLFAVLALRGALLAGALLAVLALLWVLLGSAAGALLDLADPPLAPPVPAPTPAAGTVGGTGAFTVEETAVLNTYFFGLQQRCATGTTMLPEACGYAVGLPAQQQLLVAFGWFDCRQAGGTPDDCATLLPR